MKEQDQVRAIAELDGYEIKSPSGFSDRVALDWAHAVKGDIDVSLNQLNYLHSYDAIIPVIQKQSFIVRTQMADFLSEELFEGYDGSDYIQQSQAIQFVTATPSQLCEALLRASGKWIE